MRAPIPVAACCESEFRRSFGCLCSFSVVCCQAGHCDEPVCPPKKSHRVWCVIVCDSIRCSNKTLHLQRIDRRGQTNKERKMKPTAELLKEVSLNDRCLGVKLDILLVQTYCAVSSFKGFERLWCLKDWISMCIVWHFRSPWVIKLQIFM